MSVTITEIINLQIVTELHYCVLSGPLIPVENLLKMGLCLENLAIAIEGDCIYFEQEGNDHDFKIWAEKLSLWEKEEWYFDGTKLRGYSEFKIAEILEIVDYRVSISSVSDLVPA